MARSYFQVLNYNVIYASSPPEAKAKSVHWAMSHALNRGYSKVIFETDSLCLVKGHLARNCESFFRDIVPFNGF